MTSPKFDETDRRKVIAEIESHYQVKLTRVGTRRKYLQDQNKRTFWIFGGYEDWHGIPAEMMEAEEKRNVDGILVVAKRGRTRIDIYTGPLLPLIKNKKSLSHTQKGEYQFNIRLRGNSLTIHEVPELHLSALGTASYPTEEKASDKAFEKVETIIRKLSPEAREQLFAELSKKGET
jgi:hypothetical protein